MKKCQISHALDDMISHLRDAKYASTGLRVKRYFRLLEAIIDLVGSSIAEHQNKCRVCAPNYKHRKG